MAGNTRIFQVRLGRLRAGGSLQQVRPPSCSSYIWRSTGFVLGRESGTSTFYEAELFTQTPPKKLASTFVLLCISRFSCVTAVGNDGSDDSSSWSPPPAQHSTKTRCSCSSKRHHDIVRTYTVYGDHYLKILWAFRDGSVLYSSINSTHRIHPRVFLRCGTGERSEP